MTERTMKALADLAARYQKYGITQALLVQIMQTKPEDIGESEAIEGIKMALSQEYGTREYCSMETACKITGMEPGELTEELAKIGAEVITDVKFGLEPPDERK